jgi:hypothetical protein
MHFNHLCLQVRNFLVTFLGGILVAVSYLYKENVSYALVGYSFNAGSLIIVVGFFILIAIKIMDSHWYHQLLIGSVKSGSAIENELIKLLGIPNLELLTNQITKDSRKVKLKPLVSWDRTNKKLRYSVFNSSRRMNLFYGLLFVSYLILGAGFFLATTRPVQPVMSSIEVIC